MHQHKTGPYEMVPLDVVLNGAVPNATIHNGDLVSFVAATGKALKAADFTWDTNLATTQAEFIVLFAGISEGESLVGSTDPRQTSIPVCVDGTCLMDMLASTDLFVGKYLGPAKDAGGNYMSNKLAVVASKSLAVAVVVENTNGASLTVKARLLNTITKK